MSEFSKHYYLNAIIADIKAIRSFIEGMTFDDYADDLKTQYATERAILNISETARNFEKHGKQVDCKFSLNSVPQNIQWSNIKGICSLNLSTSAPDALKLQFSSKCGDRA